MSSKSQLTLTHSQAACVFFGEDMSPENELICEQKIDAILDVELCYINNIPTEPFLVAKSRIKFFPFRYQVYRRGNAKANLPSKSTDNQHIHHESQLIEFVNSVFLINDPRNEVVYEQKELSSEDIFNITTQYTTLYEKKKSAAFTHFATKKRLNFLKAQRSRKRTDSGRRLERKTVYVMKAGDQAFLAQNIGNYQERYERFIKSLKTDGFEVLGYARKSPHKLSSEALKKNLQNMITCLQKRSLVESVYVSPNSAAQSAIASRDMTNTEEELKDMELDNCAGSTQTFLVYLASTEKKVCLTIVDYAALSTKPADVLALVKNYKSLENIVVECLKETGRYEVYRRLEILQKPDCLDSFDCRKAFPHRSI